MAITKIQMETVYSNKTFLTVINIVDNLQVLVNNVLMVFTRKEVLAVSEL